MARKKKSNTTNKILSYIAWGLSFVALILSTFVGGYYFGYASAKEDATRKVNIEKQKRLVILKKLEDATTKNKAISVNKRLQEVLKKDRKTYSFASHEYDSLKDNKPPKALKRDIKKTVSRPKLAIIIDDVGVKAHVDSIKNLGIPITMSFLPPSKFRPNTPSLASKERIYMVHLPLEAQSYSAEEPDTLRVSDSASKISARIKYIKAKFPRVSYINNHTGSKFTQNELAMNRLIYALKSNNINFIDSRTTAKTKAPRVMKNLGLSYVSRDVFLDHYHDKKSIKKAIKQSIAFAKKHGTAIAIGHPHKNTIAALSESKELFKEVELVYIDKLY